MIFFLTIFSLTSFKLADASAVDVDSTAVTRGLHQAR
jgi:hypothetical protein